MQQIYAEAQNDLNHKLDDMTSTKLHLQTCQAVVLGRDESCNNIIREVFKSLSKVILWL